MIVVADSSPLNYLIQIHRDTLLQQLYQRLVLPAGVLQELRHAAAPTAVESWLLSIPAWVEIVPVLDPPDPHLLSLGLGEREAIQIAQERRADLLLMDERKGRLEAARRGLKTTGTVGVLLAGEELGLLDAEPAFYQLLKETTFRSSPALEAEFLLQLHRIRDGSPPHL